MQFKEEQSLMFLRTFLVGLELNAQPYPVWFTDELFKLLFASNAVIVAVHLGYRHLPEQKVGCDFLKFSLSGSGVVLPGGCRKAAGR